MEPAPILLFCYKRLDVLKHTVSALQQNYLAEQSPLYIFSDGAKTANDEKKIADVREYLQTIKGFKSVTIVEAPANKGLANSIIGGVTSVFQTYDRVIVLEDDLITSVNFLSFINQALDYYEHKNVFSICGFSFPINGIPKDSVYFSLRSSSWGWATWKNRWEKVDWAVKDYPLIKNNFRRRRAFNKMGSDLAGMLDRQMTGKVDSWAIRWCYHQFKIQSYTVHPSVSKIQNAGFGNEATHTNETESRYKTVLDDSAITEFSFRDDLQIDDKIIGQVTKHYSLKYRAYYKVLNLFYRNLAKLPFKATAL